MPAQDIFQMITAAIAKELHKQTIQDEIVRPLLKWLFWNIMPYGIAIIILNFFTTIGAISLVLYLKR